MQGASSVVVRETPTSHPSLSELDFAEFETDAHAEGGQQEVGVPARERVRDLDTNLINCARNCPLPPETA